MAIRDRFGGASVPTATWRREGMPDPAQVAGKGIVTKESLGWLSSKEPDAPALELTIDDLALFREAHEAAEKEHRARINHLRAELQSRPDKARRDFATARDYRNLSIERE